MGLQDVMALAVVAGAVAFLSRDVWRATKGQHRCACSHAEKPDRDGKPAIRATGQSPASRRAYRPASVTRLPLVTVDEVGKPYPPEHDTPPDAPTQNP